MKAVLHHVQALRFVAAAMVLLSHLQHEVPSIAGLAREGWVPWRPVYFAGGVDIFFVISGFIMYTIASADFGRPGSAREFLVRRLLRIVPPYWLFTTAMVVAAVAFSSHVAHSQLSPVHVLASYFFIPVANAYGKLFPVLILGWTLNFEMLFYGVFTVGLLFPRRAGLAVIGGVIALLGLAGLVFVPPGPFAFWCNPIVFEFLMGIAIAWARQRGVTWPPAAAIAAVMVGVVLMVLAMRSGLADHAWLARPLWMGVPAALLCAAAVFVREKATPGPVLRALMFGGDASFAIYLSHPFTLTAVAALWRFTGVVQPTAYIAAAAVASIGVAAVLHVVLERPLMKRLNARARDAFARRPSAIPLFQREEPHAH
jgi:exopolysaccharide production protein ExoZ